MKNITIKRRWGFRARMKTKDGRNIINHRRRVGRYSLAKEIYVRKCS
jgi:ribosomal protein L34